jgi:hypothetical protein
VKDATHNISNVMNRADRSFVTCTTCLAGSTLFSQRQWLSPLLSALNGDAHSIAETLARLSRQVYVHFQALNHHAKNWAALGGIRIPSSFSSAQ